jgi:hypothetical protein
MAISALDDVFRTAVGEALAGGWVPWLAGWAGGKTAGWRLLRGFFAASAERLTLLRLSLHSDVAGRAAGADG